MTILGAIGWVTRGVPAPAQTTIQNAAERNSSLDVGLLKPDERNAARDAISSQPITKLRAAGDESRRRWLALPSREAWERELRNPAITSLRKSLGDFPATTSGKVVVHETGVIRGDGFEIAKIVFESEPQVWVTANLYRPAKPSGDAGTDSKADDASKKKSRPGIIICHAHHTPKEHGELQDMGMTWARLGCVVLVPDAIGHGERRQHPFVSASDYPREFRVSRQDYNFRYDVGVQLHLAGRSLIGQIAWDLRRGVDVLLSQPGVDPARIALLGSVAGGGDPAAVAAAVDDRIAVVAPFNFGGPQPETRFPLPDDIETSFLYTGSGGWESTRNLRSSAAGGFLPWVIVGGIAPRRVIYSHEFSWDRERDPVWKRLEKIYSWYELRDRLSFTHGRGELKGRPPEASHCTHIGPLHRRLIHETLAQAFGLPADAASREFSKNLPTEELRCWTPELTAKLAPRPLREVLRAKLDAAAEQ
ncbi:MAG TPA: hypothetical protein PLV92_02420, partial [Pirellulaceae bacterium]|nr:hypothetical protein [Pirellulaceae bacterium]